MSDRENITDALDARFFAPLRRPRTRRVGVELELPVWNRTPGAATDFAAVHAVTDEFLSRFPFTDTALDDTGALYRARDPATGDELSFDCSFNTSFRSDRTRTSSKREGVSSPTIRRCRRRSPDGDTPSPAWASIRAGERTVRSRSATDATGCCSTI